jgi:hypothetical protein
MHLEWVKAARDDGDAAKFLQRYVSDPADQVAYLDAVGGAERLLSVMRWES